MECLGLRERENWQKLIRSGLTGELFNCSLLTSDGGDVILQHTFNSVAPICQNHAQLHTANARN